MYAVEWVSPPTQPYATILNVGNTEMFKHFAANPFAYTLPSEDLGRLAADPIRRARWEELIMHTVLPPLRQLVPVIQTKVRMNDAAPVQRKFVSCAMLCGVMF